MTLCLYHRAGSYLGCIWAYRVRSSNRSETQSHRLTKIKPLECLAAPAVHSLLITAAASARPARGLSMLNRTCHRPPGAFSLGGFGRGAPMGCPSDGRAIAERLSATMAELATASLLRDGDARS